ncbi:hypothetical protein JS528_01695 [Bifidobacterium sp. MA2]|uniref:SPOR domain-containing protein n=1 Tax=Bifidobacterium santillanense TaxID=2809028 RepID=A0ABS5UME9_9BIFI|nr:hypothetical protein [Bifidobacterium santillanense]MBT1172091.1 hypothetical protein [Bifidobacterium santillanense]
MADQGKQWYFNIRTGEPELGPKSPIEQRMGPYRSREDALDAWRIFQERETLWKEQDRRWNLGWDAPARSAKPEEDGPVNDNRM